MPPRWISRVCLGALLTGLVLTVLGPIGIWALATATAGDAGFEAARDLWWGRLFWIVPLGTGALFFGVIGLLFVWVTRLAEENRTEGP